MSYKWGAAAEDYMKFTMPNPFPSTARSNILFCGWFYPTTLTANRYLLGSGTGADLRLYITNPADDLAATQAFSSGTSSMATKDNLIVANTWQFIAAFWTAVDSAASDIITWRGTSVIPPTKMAFDDYTGFAAGTINSDTELVIGNLTSGSSASFEGDIGWVAGIHDSANNNENIFGISSLGTISTAEEDLLLNRFILPMWLGSPNLQMANYAAHDKTFQAFHVDLATALPIASVWSNSGVTPVTVTVSGPTYTANEPPTRLSHRWPLQYGMPMKRL